MEINSSPGFEGLEAATRQDIAGEMIDFALAFAESRQASERSQRRVSGNS
jgi:ribosomal protein S6--L-glutamate ligase